MRAASPRPSGGPGGAPAAETALTRSRAGWSRVAPEVSPARSAHPSMAALSKGGSGRVARSGRARNRPLACGNRRTSVPSGATSDQAISRARSSGIIALTVS